MILRTFARLSWPKASLLFVPPELSVLCCFDGCTFSQVPWGSCPWHHLG